LQPGGGKDEGDNFYFHFANGGWEVLMEIESSVKPEADAARFVSLAAQSL
jgi:hypothetical protein